MDFQLLSFIRLTIIVLLPIIPAFLLFKILPATAIVTGLLQGWKVNLSGAFAAYFALVLLVISTHSVWDPAPLFQTWTVDGKIVDEDGNPVKLLPIQEEITMDPPSIKTRGTGTFEVDIHTAVGQTGRITYPQLIITLNPFLQREIELDPQGKDSASARELEMQWDPTRQRIHISRIKLQRPRPYISVGRPTPVEAPEGDPHP